MKYVFSLLYSIGLIIMGIGDYVLKTYDIVSVLVITLAALLIFVMRKRIMQLESDAKVEAQDE